MSVESQLVQLGVVVRDARGHAVAGLTKDDFEISDEGKRRAIANFSAETRARAASTPSAAPAQTVADTRPVAGAPPAAAAPPRSVLLFFDDLHTVTGELRRTQNAAQHFVKEGLGMGDRAAIFAASEGLTLGFTADAAQLIAAIEKLRSHVRVTEAGLSPCPRISPYDAYVIANGIDPSAMAAAVSEAHQCDAADTSISNVYSNTSVRPGALSKLPSDQLSIVVQAQAAQTWEAVRTGSLQTYDAMASALARLAQAPGTRVLLLASEGFLTGNEDSARPQSLIDTAIRSGIVINSLDAKGLWSEAPGRPLNEVNETVGFPIQTYIYETSAIGTRNLTLNATMWDLASATGGLFFHNSNDLTAGFQQLAAVPETTYLLAFRPDPAEAPGKYHKLKVRLASGHSGYVQTRPGYFAPLNSPDQEAPGKLDREAMASDSISDIPVRLAGRFGKTPQGEPLLSLQIHVDLAKLQFTPRDGRQSQRLHFIGLLRDSKGSLAAAKEGWMDFSLKEDTFARLTASGVNADLSLSAPPGPYEVRVVVEDAAGKLTALSQRVEIPK